jgi:hypothetical protein
VKEKVLRLVRRADLEPVGRGVHSVHDGYGRLILWLPRPGFTSARTPTHLLQRPCRSLGDAIVIACVRELRSPVVGEIGAGEVPPMGQEMPQL